MHEVNRCWAAGGIKVHDTARQHMLVCAAVGLLLKSKDADLGCDLLLLGSTHIVPEGAGLETIPPGQLHGGRAQ